jgi:hypothetical protein
MSSGSSSMIFGSGVSLPAESGVPRTLRARYSEGLSGYYQLPTKSSAVGEMRSSISR